MRYGHAHTSFESGQQQNWIDGYSRYNQTQHHLNHHGNYSNSFNGHFGGMREGYHANSETNSQFYYQNAHPTSSPGYYGNHSYESYRNAPASGYHYHYGGAGYHQTPSHSSQYMPTYSGASEQFNNRYYPTPPPSAPPIAATQRDPYSISQANEPATAYASMIDRDLNDKHSNERLPNNDVKNSQSDPLPSSPHSPLTRQSTAETVEHDENKMEVQQTKVEETSAPKCELLKEQNRNESVKDDEKGNNTSETAEPTKTESHSNQSTSSLFNENSDHNHHHLCNESLTKGNNAQELATDVENSLATGE